MPLENIGMMDARSAIGNAPQVPNTPSFADKFHAQEQSNDLTKQKEDERQLKMWNDMLSKPESAPAIASAYGVQFTPEMKLAMDHPAQTAKLLQGITMGKELFKDSAQKSAFAKSWATGADFQSAVNDGTNAPPIDRKDIAPLKDRVLPNGQLYDAATNTATDITGYRRGNKPLGPTMEKSLYDPEGQIKNLLMSKFPDADASAKVDPALLFELARKTESNYQTEGEIGDSMENAYSTVQPEYVDRSWWNPRKSAFVLKKQASPVPPSAPDTAMPTPPAGVAHPRIHPLTSSMMQPGMVPPPSPDTKVKVTNGTESYFIPAARADEAARDGFRVVQ